jgi:hypothetical protein
MGFNFRTFHVELRCDADREGLYVARAIVTTPGTLRRHPSVFDSEAIARFESHGDAVACARSWAIEYCEHHRRPAEKR